MRNQDSYYQKDRPAMKGSGVKRGDGNAKPCSTHSLTAREMESLVAICETLIPSTFSGSEVNHFGNDVAVFHASSAAQAGTSDQVAKLICANLHHPKKWLLRATLWLLSTHIGSVVLCGRRSFSGEYPYCQRFSRLPLKKREEIMLSWALSFFSLLRMFFKAVKLIISLVFFTQVDEELSNPTWKAIGYTGPNSERSYHEDQTMYSEGKQNPEEIFGPLHKGIIDLKNPRETVIESLNGFGFQASIQEGKNKDKALRGYLKSDPVMKIRCDVVVVGSGSGGGVIAGVLAKAGYKVLVLEKGYYYARSNLSLLEGQALEKMYLSNGVLATTDMSTIFLAGSTVGGGSTINWSASIRTPDDVIREWSEKFGLQLFGSESYRKAMDVVCERMGVQTGVTEEGFNNLILRKGCEELRYPVKTSPRNTPADHYCGFCAFGCKKGQKKGTAETWLVDAVHSSNGVILPGCEALQVLQKHEHGKNIATGVVFQFEKECYVVESKVTIVACGALRTPHLLKCSGLKNPNIGRNLHIHPATMAWGYFPEEKWPEKRKVSYQGGIITAMSSVFTDVETPNCYGSTIIQTPALHPGVFSGLIPWISGKDFKTRMLKFSRTAHIFTLTRDRSCGTIQSPSSISYTLNKTDEQNLQKGIEKILRILTAAGAEEIGTHNSEGKSLSVKNASAEEYEKFVREESSKPIKALRGQICSAHQMGSCRMGSAAEHSAVKPTGETWEVDGLFVADSSVFPTALGVNPMVTIQTIAYCVGRYVVDVLAGIEAP